MNNRLKILLFIMIWLLAWGVLIGIVVFALISILKTVKIPSVAYYIITKVNFAMLIFSSVACFEFIFMVNNLLRIFRLSVLKSPHSIHSAVVFSIVVAMIISLTPDQFELIATVIAFFLIFQRFFPTPLNKFVKLFIRVDNYFVNKILDPFRKDEISKEQDRKKDI
ncbi:hypothetical protein [Lactobacillus sp. 3B(2020)]|uniref:hypothetical protein n=1 Tax=Lactobacillus sp. 3B(2020) TaxID=2695882 RepID=UPI0015DE771F|nr:hypothetical protein [Lactobacillus sp. 3B(2020)]QLL69835.1 hypothetical protein GTO83_04425 [Lactobacillus sp. 3B(2020)]